MSIRVEGVERAVRNLKRYARQKRAEVDRATQDATFAVERGAKHRAPAGFGRLRSAIHTVIEPLQGDVRVGVFYAPFVEFGTGTRVFETNQYTFSEDEKEYAKQFRRGPGRNVPAKPFLFPAWDAQKSKYIDKVKDILRRV